MTVLKKEVLFNLSTFCAGGLNFQFGKLHCFPSNHVIRGNPDHKREKESFQKWHKTFSNARMRVPIPNFTHNFYHYSSITKICTCVPLPRNIVSLPNADRSKSRMLSQEVIKLRRKPELFCYTSTLHWMPT